jgi:putative ribosome biogenesis GTPase RsgA
LIDVAKSDLLSHFPDLAAAAKNCAAACAHEEESVCALRSLPRYPSYRSIRASLTKPD